eukprot:758974-Hanusia_phi.AAC.7
MNYCTVCESEFWAFNLCSLDMSPTLIPLIYISSLTSSCASPPCSLPHSHFLPPPPPCSCLGAFLLISLLKGLLLEFGKFRGPGGRNQVRNFPGIVGPGPGARGRPPLSKLIHPGFDNPGRPPPPVSG